MPEDAASTAYHQIGKFTVSAEPVKPLLPYVLCDAATVADVGLGLVKVGGGV